MRNKGPWLAMRFGLLSIVLGCSAIVDTSLTGGIGAQCASDADCHASSCSLAPGSSVGLCVQNCSSDIDCPRPSRCITSPGSSSGQSTGLCQLELPVQAFYIGVGTADEGWSLTHQQGLAYAQSQLGYIAGAAMPAAGVTWAFSNFVFQNRPAKKPTIALTFDGGLML